MKNFTFGRILKNYFTILDQGFILNKAAVHKTVILFVIIVLLCVCTGCHAQDVKVETGTDGYVESIHEEAAKQAESDDANTEQETETGVNPATNDSENAKHLCLPDGQSDFAADCQEEHDSIENIYQWEIVYGSIGNETEAAYHPYDDGYGPDGIVYNRRGEPFVEYYIEESEKKYCFVVHLWGNYWIDYETGVSAYQDAVYCTTHTVQEADWTGAIFICH